MYRIIQVVFIFGLLFSSGVFADESWIDHSDGRVIIYETDLPGNTAVFLQKGDGTEARIFIPDWNYSQPRGGHDAFWIQYDDGEEGCDEALPDPMGIYNAVYRWGSMRIEFDQSTYPSGWSASFSYCDGPLEHGFYASPQ